MPDVKWSELPDAGTVTGVETIVIVQDGVSKKTTVDSVQGVPESQLEDLEDEISLNTDTKIATHDTTGHKDLHDVTVLQPGLNLPLVAARPLESECRNGFATHKIFNAPPGINEVKRYSCIGATSGTITWTYKSVATASVNYNASAATIETTLEAHPQIGVGNVQVTGGPINAAAVDVEFTGDLAGQNIDSMSMSETTNGPDVASTIVSGQDFGILSLDTLQRMDSTVPGWS